MPSRLTTIAAMTLAALFAAPANAQDIKPGLYQVTTKVAGDNELGAMMKQQKDAMAKLTPQQREQMADMPRQLERMMADMSPEQRKQMGAMIGKQGGALEALKSMQMTHNADGSTSVKMCVTQAMIDQRAFATQHGECKQNNSKMVRGVMKIAYTCTRPPSKGEGEVRMTGPNSFSTNMTMTSTDPANKQSMVVDSNATWLGASCGDVKPIDAGAFKQ